MGLFQDNSRCGALHHVEIKNYKSIGSCSVSLGRLTVLVGHNGAGKSNFLDALRFVTEALQTSLEHAIRSRGGINKVRRLSTGHPRNFAITLLVGIGDFSCARYGFEVAAAERGRFVVKRESLQIKDSSGEITAHYALERGSLLNGSPGPLPAPSSNRLYLVAASGLLPFRPVYDALVSMGFHNLNPDVMKETQNADSGELLHRDGSNIASVVERLALDEPEAFSRIREYLEQIVPGIKDVRRVSAGPKETLEFRLDVKGSQTPWRFWAINMSDGTLRALGALTAVAQLANRETPLTLVGLEEPETALHPAASAALVDALREASKRTQILITTHSPELLDQIDPSSDRLYVVESRKGETHIGEIDSASFEAVRDQLYTPGELLRMDQLEAESSTPRKRPSQPTLPFEIGDFQEEDD